KLIIFGSARNLENMTPAEVILSRAPSGLFDFLFELREARRSQFMQNITTGGIPQHTIFLTMGEFRPTLNWALPDHIFTELDRRAGWFEANEEEKAWLSPTAVRTYAENSKIAREIVQELRSGN